MTARRKVRRAFAASIRDGAIVYASLWAALWLRFGGAIPGPLVAHMVVLAPIGTALMLAFAWARGLYRGWARYVSIGEIIAIIEVVTGTTAVLSLLSSIDRGTRHLMPLSVALIAAPLMLLGLGGVRLVQRLTAYGPARTASREQRLLVVGAGDAGEMVVRDIVRTPNPFLPIGFLDDDPAKRMVSIHGIPVLGPLSALRSVVADHDVQHVLIAMPTAPPEVISRVVDDVAATGATAKILPSIPAVIQGAVTAADIRDVDVADLIGRHPVRINVPEVGATLEGRTVLVTGAAGSIGSELARQVLTFRPRRLVLLDMDETNLFYLDQELAHPAVEAVVGDVRDAARVERLFARWRPDVVYHAAAYKHVPVMERDPSEAVRTNITGTRLLVAAAKRYNTQRFILVSTDKAVEPVNVMGASKRVAELLLSHQDDAETIFASVRFGNVVGSRGSVVPIFARQIASGGPITLTHPDATRYFMTIEEAAALIIQAGVFAAHAETFVLDMGEPVKIADLADRMRRVLGGGREIAIKVTGMRPGEKLHEDLWHESESLLKTPHPRIYRVSARPAGAEPSSIADEVERIERLAADDDAPAIREALFGLTGGGAVIHLGGSVPPPPRALP